MTYFVTDHFRQRVAERCPPGTDAAALAGFLRDAVLNDRRDLIDRVMPAVSEGGRARHFWRVVLPCGTPMYALVYDHNGVAVTTMTHEQFRITRAACKARRKREVLEREAVRQRLSAMG